MAREKYVSLLDIKNEIMPFPKESAQWDRDDIRGCSVRKAAQDAQLYLRETIQEVIEKRATLGDIIQKLFYPFRDERPAPKNFVEVVSLIDCNIPPNATCLVACSELNPLSATIGICTMPIADLPADWVKGELAQPAGVVLARRLEKFIDYALAGAIMAREFTDDAKVAASKGLIILQASKKK